MIEVDSIDIYPDSGGWTLRLNLPRTAEWTARSYEYAIGDPGQFNEETRRTLGRWLAEDNLIRAAYAEPVEPQSIRADLDTELDALGIDPFGREENR